jgi:5,10-methylenetetrahydromethanopterin reductase
VRIALGFNPVMSVHDMTALAVKAEEKGFDSIWMHESLFQRDVVTYLSSMGGATKSIRLGSGVINTFTRHPVASAATFATLSESSGGRTVLGLGVGSFPTIPLIGHQIFPVEENRPLKRLKEYIEIVRKVWSGEKVEFKGEFFEVRGLTVGFPVRGHIPLFVGSLSPVTQEYAGATTDGVILSPALSTVKGTAAMVANVAKGEAKSGKRVERASYMMTSIDPDRKKAVDAVRDYYFFVYQLADVVKPETLQPYGVTPEKLAPMKEAWKKGDVPGAKRLIPEEAIEALAVAGDRSHAEERISEYVKAGVTLPIAMPIGNVEYAMDSLSPR